MKQKVKTLKRMAAESMLTHIPDYWSMSEDELPKPLRIYISEIDSKRLAELLSDLDEYCEKIQQLRDEVILPGRYNDVDPDEYGEQFEKFYVEEILPISTRIRFIKK